MKRSEEEAYDALYFYRGDSEVSRWVCINAFVMTLSDYPNRKELERMKTNNDDHKKPSKENLSVIEKYKMTLKRLCCREFLKPFLFLNLILNFGLEWAGFPALAFYMHTVLKQMEIPLDEYWVAVALAGYRSALTVALSFVLYKVAPS